MTSLAALSLRDAARGLLRQKTLAAVAVLTLGLGLALCTAMVCVLYGVILRPLSYGDAQRVAMVWVGYKGGGSERDMLNEHALPTWRSSGRVFEDVAGFNYTTFTLLQRGEPASVQGAIVSPEIFSVLRVKAQVGAVFTPELAHKEQGKLALLSHKLWRQRFDSNPAAVGQTVDLSHEIYTIVGVMPDDFDVPSHETGIWVPLTSGHPTGRPMMVIARLRDGVAMPEAQADAERIAAQLAQERPEVYQEMRVHLVPFFDELVRESRPLVLVGSLAALLVLLICCANVSNLLLVRTIIRRPEFATRSAVGARRLHLLGVVFAEGLLVALCAGLVGGVLARFLIAALLQVSPVELPRGATIGQGLQIPAVTALLILAAALLTSLPAAWDVARAKLAVDAARSARSTSRRFARQAIVAMELGVALTLLAGSGLMVRTMLALRDANPGWKTDHLLSATILLPQTTYREPRQILQFFETLIERLRAAPGVVSAAASSAVPANPVGADFDIPVQVPGQASEAEPGRAGVRWVTSGYFQTAGIPLIQGRDFDDGDRDPQARRIMVNQTFLKKYLPNAPTALGQQVNVALGPPQPYEIVGVVGDVHHYGVLREPKPEFYMPFATRPFMAMGLVVRTAGDPLAFAPEFRKQLWAIDPELPIAAIDSMDHMLEATWNDRTVLALLMAFFTVVVVILTLVGVFSVVAFSVSRQVQEIGIRMALGAQARDVVNLVMGQSARTVLAGIVLGLGGAWLLGRALASLMYRVSASDPLVLLAGSVVLAVVAALGSYLPSRRAARIDPVAALRAD